MKDLLRRLYSMSPYAQLKLEDSSSIGDVDMLVDDVDVTQFVNPQDTDKRYSRPQLDCSHSILRAPNGYVTPGVLKVGSDDRRASLTISETRSSESSFDSSSGCMTPRTPVSAASASSSRSQSMKAPGNQQSYLSPCSPCPVPRSPRLKQVAYHDHYSLHQPFAPEAPVDCTHVALFMTECGAPYGLDDQLSMNMSNYANNAQAGWQSHQASNDFMSLCEQAMNVNTSASLSMDLAQNFTYAMTARPSGYSQQYIHGSQTQLFSNLVPTTEIGLCPAAVNSAPGNPTLEPPFEFVGGVYGPNKDFSDDDNIPDVPLIDESVSKKRLVKKRNNPYIRTNSANELLEAPDYVPDSICQRPAGQKTKKSRKTVKKTGRLEIGGWSLVETPPISSENKKHPCPHCPYKFVRPEHLARHKKSRHEANTKYYACRVHDCKDRDGKHKMIKARGDNLAPHYTNTHFTFGNSDRSGKNRRISLKESLEIGLYSWDPRWPLFLNGQISLDSESKGAWKMLGYSIRETRDTRIKTIIQDWEGSDDATLELVDYRWHMLKDGSMDFETAMAGGHKMVESERRDKGLLGVTMMESEEMGLKQCEPRWLRLLSGKMTIDESEVLGVKHLNPTWLALQAKRRH